MPPIFGAGVSGAEISQLEACLMDDAVSWRQVGKETWLVYLERPILKYAPEGPGFRVTTRCYSDGFQQSRLLATQGVARRYADAWMAKWGDRAKADVRNKLAPASPTPIGDAFGWPYPQIVVKARKARRRR